MRNRTWISPQIPTDAQTIDDSNREVVIGRHYYTEQEKQAFRNDESFHLAYRKLLESKMGKKFPVFIRGTEDNIRAKQMFKEDMLRKLGPGLDELKDKLIPEWSPGCRRMTVSNQNFRTRQT